jgi:hypothetical protein
LQGIGCLVFGDSRWVARTVAAPAFGSRSVGFVAGRVAGVEVRDAVWRELVVRARRDGPAWVVAAVGVAMPGLRRIAGLLTAGWRGDTDDLDSELIVGFVARLKTIDLDVPRICDFMPRTRGGRCPP